MLWLLARSSAWNRENGDFERKWGHFGDPKTEKGPHGDPGTQMGTHLGAVHYNSIFPGCLKREEVPVNVFATDRSVSVRCVLILFHSGHLVGHHVTNLQFIYKPLKRTLTNSLTYKKPWTTRFRGPLFTWSRSPFAQNSATFWSLF